MATNGTELATQQHLVSVDSGPLSYLMDTARFLQLKEIAKAMALSSLMPDHLKGRTPQESAANCFLVVNQAIRWGFDPFAVAPETYAVGGKLGYQGKLVAAVVNARAGLASRLTYEYSGEGQDRTVKITGVFKETKVPCVTTLSVKQALAGFRGTPHPMWTSDPDQKLAYSGVIRWARRYCPEVVLGVMTDDEVTMIAADAEPRAARYRAPEPAPIEVDVVPEPEPAPTTDVNTQKAELADQKREDWLACFDECDTVSALRVQAAAFKKAHPEGDVLYKDERIMQGYSDRMAAIKAKAGKPGA